MKRSRSKFLIGWFAALILPWLAGCATNDEQLSERPWNAPKSWESGLPSGMTDERR